MPGAAAAALRYDQLFCSCSALLKNVCTFREKLPRYLPAPCALGCT